MDTLPRLAQSSDKKNVLNFCQNTFSWGDYIHEVWDNWINEGNLIVIENDQIPVSMAHVGFYPDEKMIWIEGIRVNQNFRKKGFAQKMIHHFEDPMQNHKNSKYLECLLHLKIILLLP